jgi:hypothetical protein
MSERIFPLPHPLREALVRSFAPSAVKKSDVLMLDTNKDCLVRVYLGRRMHHLVRRDTLAPLNSISPWHAAEGVLGSIFEYTRRHYPAQARCENVNRGAGATAGQSIPAGLRMAVWMQSIQLI